MNDLERLQAIDTQQTLNLLIKHICYLKGFIDAISDDEVQDITPDVDQWEIIKVRIQACYWEINKARECCEKLEIE